MPDLLAALLHPTNGAFDDLQHLVSPGEHVALFTASPLDVLGGWQVDRSRWIHQMICEASLDSPPLAPLPLGTTDVPEMVDLTAATEPGPFLPQTIQMGSYFGIRASDGRLVAMAGERLQSTAFAEISAVCTLPEFHGRGYARALTTFLAAQKIQSGVEQMSTGKSASVYLSLAGVGFPRYRLRSNSDLLHVDSEFATQVRR